MRVWGVLAPEQVRELVRSKALLTGKVLSVDGDRVVIDFGEFVGEGVWEASHALPNKGDVVVVRVKEEGPPVVLSFVKRIKTAEKEIPVRRFAELPLDVPEREVKELAAFIKLAVKVAEQGSEAPVGGRFGAFLEGELLSAILNLEASLEEALKGKSVESVFGAFRDFVLVASSLVADEEVKELASSLPKIFTRSEVPVIKRLSPKLRGILPGVDDLIDRFADVVQDSSEGNLRSLLKAVKDVKEHIGLLVERSSSSSKQATNIYAFSFPVIVEKRRFLTTLAVEPEASGAKRVFVVRMLIREEDMGALRIDMSYAPDAGKRLIVSIQASLKSTKEELEKRKEKLARVLSSHGFVPSLSFYHNPKIDELSFPVISSSLEVRA